jgi:glycosyltransferase involved in cell wall biosynthesis
MVFDGEKDESENDSCLNGKFGEACITVPELSKRVSIGMPVYNGEEFIREALNSIVSQTYQNFELIISDNASADGTEKICLEYAQKDSRIRYVRQLDNRGPAANFQYVLNEAKGEYFMWAAHDDLWGADFVSAGVEALALDQDAVAAFGRVEYVNQENEIFLIDLPPYGLCNNPYRSTATYLNTNIPDHLIYALYRRAFLTRHGWNAGVSSPDKNIIFNAVVTGGYMDAPRMELRIRYRAKTKSELKSIGLRFTRWQGFYMSYLMASIIWHHFPLSVSMRLLKLLLKYRTPVVHRVLRGVLKEHPGRIWVTKGASSSEYKG